MASARRTMLLVDYLFLALVRPQSSCGIKRMARYPLDRQCVRRSLIGAVTLAFLLSLGCLSRYAVAQEAQNGTAPEIERIRTVLDFQQKKLVQQQQILIDQGEAIQSQRQELQDQLEEITRQRQQLDAQQKLIDQHGTEIARQRQEDLDQWDRHLEQQVRLDGIDEVVIGIQQTVTPLAQMQRERVLEVDATGPAGGQPSAGAANSGAGVQPQQAPDTYASAAPPPSADRPPDVEVIRDRGGVLTPQGRLVVEPSIEYLHDSNDRVVVEGFTIIPALVIGSIDVRKVDRDTLIGSLSARYGFTSRFETDIKVPYVRRNDSTTARAIGTSASSDIVTEVSGDGIGDVTFGGHYQINDGMQGWPFFIGNLRVKTPTGKDPFEINFNENGLPAELPTGTGFWAVEPSLTFIKPSDPVVWFGNVKYLANLPRDLGENLGELDPGDAFGVSVGLGFGVNKQTSFSLGWEQQIIFESAQNGSKISGSSLDIGTFLLGMTYRINDQTSLNLTFQAGVTDDATDMRVQFRVPFSFDLFE